MTELEKSMAEIAKANGLRTIQIGYSAIDDGHEHFTVNALWSEPSREYGCDCAIGHADTLIDALEKALTEATIRRTPALADEAIQLGEAA